MAVARDWRGRGLGEQLVRHALAQGRMAGCDEVNLAVRPPNGAALGLYRKLGYQVIGRCRHYCSDDKEDALIMRLPLGPEMVRGKSLKGSRNGCYDQSSTRPR